MGKAGRRTSAGNSTKNARKGKPDISKINIETNPGAARQVLQVRHLHYNQSDHRNIIGQYGQYDKAQNHACR